MTWLRNQPLARDASQLADYGFDMRIFEDSRSQMERLLARGDAIEVRRNADPSLREDSHPSKCGP